MHSSPKCPGPTGPDCESGRALNAWDRRSLDTRQTDPGLAKLIKTRVQGGFYDRREVIDAIAKRILDSDDL